MLNTDTTAPNVDTAVIFYPRGGSAQVVRYLNRELDRRGSQTLVHAGSLGHPGDPGHAPTFYHGLRLHSYDYNEAYAKFVAGKDSQAGPRPFHPSYEDRSMPGRRCPDPMFSATAPPAAARLANAWTAHLRGRSTSPDVLHLHHLSHLQTAARRAYPHTPRVTTLHGTEMKQLQGIRERLALAEHLQTTVDALAITLDPDRPATLHRLTHEHQLDGDQQQLLAGTDWGKWQWSRYWDRAIATAVRHAGRIICVSEHERDLARELFPHLAHTDIPVITNGVDTTRFRPAELSDEQRLAFLHRWLVSDPRGWAEGQKTGSIRYEADDLARLRDPRTGHLRPLLLWVGRFLDFKRVPVLLRAFAQLSKELQTPPALLMWGGYPGECEGEHPQEIARRLGIEQDVYFVGWRGHDELPDGLTVADLMVAPAVREPFGMVYIEAMAAGCPPIATATGGPARTITPDGPDANGWLVRPDDTDDLAAAIKQALVNPLERTRRAATGAAHAARTYGWSYVADRYITEYETAIANGDGR
ncbi:glycosyltransferase family 4 protein [Kitasatospora purpeofusca]|uniref:D-inositol 3-phosphate glycosyltransferase n=1 Tax=Kitasatospora purpeofusca TaxID=67352 RepID=A0ABZ1TZ10_9ACTN|nr:glycosyltransferase family 4 protein [Kitasatospora purpeofusca]